MEILVSYWDIKFDELYEKCKENGDKPMLAFCEKIREIPEEVKYYQL